MMIVAAIMTIHAAAMALSGIRNTPSSTRLGKGPISIEDAWSTEGCVEVVSWSRQAAITILSFFSCLLQWRKQRLIEVQRFFVWRRQVVRIFSHFHEVCCVDYYVRYCPFCSFVVGADTSYFFSGSFLLSFCDATIYLLLRFFSQTSPQSPLDDSS